jgi:hypothetical protein
MNAANQEMVSSFGGLPQQTTEENVIRSAPAFDII